MNEGMQYIRNGEGNGKEVEELIKNLSLIREMVMEHYNKFKKEHWVVKPSFPILYFGDLDRYLKSKIRVVTVGKNPSYWEFFDGCKYSTELRFPKWTGDYKHIEDALNPYFETKPYEWFKSYEHVLEGMGVSYGGEYEKNRNFHDIAIHTDICTPIATNPTWSTLKRILKKGILDDLVSEGFEIWSRLIEVLKPNIILISAPDNDECFVKLKNKYALSKGELLISFKMTERGNDRKHPYDVYYYTSGIKGIDSLIIRGYGKRARKPFMIGKSQRNKVGNRIIEKYREVIY